MNVRDVMNADPVKLRLSDTFGSAFSLMLSKRIASLPVVDDMGVYRGMFDRFDIWRVLLPKAASLERGFGMDLAFASDTPEELKEKLEAVATRTMTGFLSDEKSPAVHPETPVTEAILLMYRQGSHLPVVEKASHKLVGILSPWDILQRLR